MSGPRNLGQRHGDAAARRPAQRCARMGGHRVDPAARHGGAARAACGVRQWRSLADALALAVVFTIAARSCSTRGWILTFVYPLLALALGTLGTLGGPVHERDDRARARARPVLALRARGRRRAGGRERRRQPAPRRRRARLHGAVLRPAWLHQLLRETAGDARDRGGQLLPQRDDRGDPRRRGHADLLHGRRHHGRVRRAARAARPRRPRARGGDRDDRARAWRRSTLGSPSTATITTS